MARLTESTDIAGSDFDVDEKAGVVRGVTVLKSKSKHGYAYLESAMPAHAPLYEGLPVFSPHLFEQGKQKAGVGDLVAYSTRPRFDESRGGLTVDMEAAPGDVGKRFVWAAKRKPKLLMVSHEADGNINPRTRLVESWKPERLALVFDGATTAGLNESAGDTGTGTEDDMDLKALTLDQLKTARGDLVKMVLAESQDAAKRAEVEAKLKEAEGRITILEAEKGAAEMVKVATRLLSESKLPEAAKTKKLTEALAGQKDEATAKTYLATLEESIAAARKPASAARKPAGAAAGGDDEVDARETMRRVTGRTG